MTSKEKKPYWDHEEVLGEVMIGAKQKRVVSVVAKDEDNFVSITTWKFYKGKEDTAEAWHPTGGVTIPARGTHSQEGQQIFNLIAQMFVAPKKGADL